MVARDLISQPPGGRFDQIMPLASCPGNSSQSPVPLLQNTRVVSVCVSCGVGVGGWGREAGWSVARSRGACDLLEKLVVRPAAVVLSYTLCLALPAILRLPRCVASIGSVCCQLWLDRRAEVLVSLSCTVVRRSCKDSQAPLPLCTVSEV